LERWALDRINLVPTAGADALCAFWGATLDEGATELTSLWQLLGEEASGGGVKQALDSLLFSRRSMPPRALDAAVRVGGKHLGRAGLLGHAQAALADTAVVGEQRAIWSLVAVKLDPIHHANQFLAEHGEVEAADLLVSGLCRGLTEVLGEPDQAANTTFNAMFIQAVGRRGLPQDDFPGNNVNGAIDSITRDLRPEVTDILSALIGDPLLAAWRPRLRHAQAQQVALRRDQSFRHPAPTEVQAAIAGGPPVNARDLRAVVMEELLQLRAELRTTDTNPWMDFWNLNGENVDKPLVENICGNRLLTRLKDRLKKYQIAAALPEARRKADTRTDILVLSHAGNNLPIEAKRHFHKDIWVAASTQLQDYTADPGAEGFGIYLVFWFGNGEGPTPARIDGTVGPTSATEMESMLIGDLSPALRDRTDIVVFDVSNPNTARLKNARQKRGATPKKQTNRRKNKQTTKPKSAGGSARPPPA
jgi:hypothetical protein